MSDDSWHEDAAKTARTLQILVAAMCAGILFFLVIALSMGPVLKPPATMQPISLTVIAFALVGLGLIARAILLWKITTKARREILSGAYTPIDPSRRSRPVPSADGGCRDAKYLLSVFLPKTIISAALFEGWAFFAAIAYLLEGSPVGLGLALAFCVFGEAIDMPHPDYAEGTWLSSSASC
ncbi:MAG: hypothetical protein ABSG86_12975 [Thermoguttaceae bacterium]|jgi:hypothetical protein